MDAGAGDDTVFVGSLAGAYGGTVNGIGALLQVSGGGDHDRLRVDDTADGANTQSTLDVTHLAGLGLAQGLDYFTFEDLAVSLGGGADSFTVAGTHDGATLVHTGGGDDLILVSAPAGSLDAVHGTLVLEGGSGSNTLTVSDAGDADADGTVAQPVLITNASIAGLAPGLISYAATGGSFAGGITIQGGSGGNFINVASTHRTPGVRTITLVRSGQGSDTVTVTEATPEFLVVDAQAGDDKVDASAASIAVTIFGGAGADTLTGGSGADVLFGDVGRVTYAGAAGIVLGGLAGQSMIANPGPGDSISIVETLSLGGEGGDTVNGGDGGDVILGGLGADTLSGNAGADRIVGDNAQLLYIGADLRTITSIASGTGGTDTIRGNEGNDLLVGGAGDDQLHGDAGNDLVLGDEGTVSLVDGVLQSVASLYFATGGDDTITGDADHDTVIGGAGNDIITGNGGFDYLLGDSGQLTYTVTGDLVTISSVGSGIGGVDTINGNEGDDLIVGGVDGDFLHGDTGNDLVLGDEGAISLVGGVLQSVASLNFGTGGDDTITGDPGVGVRFGVPFTETDTVFFGVGAERVKVTAGDKLPEAYADQGGTYLPATIGWARDNRDSALVPTTGRLQRINSEFGLGGDRRYAKLTYQFQQYHTDHSPIHLCVQYRAGCRQRDWAASRFRCLRNFYGGGLGSVRGFDQGTLGPTSAVVGSTTG